MGSRKDICPKCDGQKDARSMHCVKCREKPRPSDGNTFVDANGYVRINVGGRPIYAHRHAMEQHLGRKLTTREHVHHLNADRTDNRIENLCLLDTSDHGREHMTHEVARARGMRGHEIRWGKSYVHV